MSKQFMVCALIGLAVSGSIRPEETEKMTLLPRISYLAKQVSHLMALGVAFIGLGENLCYYRTGMAWVIVIIGTSATCALYDTYKKRELERELQECRLTSAESNMRTAED